MTLTVRIAAKDNRSADMLKQDGWREGDELVTYYRPVSKQTMPMGIRAAKGKDVESVVAVANQAFAPKDKTKWVRDAFVDQDRQVMVAMEDGGIVGFVITRVEGKSVVIDLIGTTHRRRGVGRALVAAVESLPYGRPDIQAGTQANNDAAREFYRSLGFVVKHRRRTFHKP